MIAMDFLTGQILTLRLFNSERICDRDGDSEIQREVLTASELAKNLNA